MLLNAGILILAFLLGSIPFSYIAAKWRKRVDLRDVDTGTVSGTSLYSVVGFPILMAVGILEVGKGLGAGFLTAGKPLLGALAAGCAVAGHNWSIFLKGAGGRGVSVGMGVLAPVAWPGTLVLALGMGLGRIFRQTGIGVFLALLMLPLILWITHDLNGFLAGIIVSFLSLLKRLLGNIRKMPSGMKSQAKEPALPVGSKAKIRLLASRLVLDK